MVSRMTFVLVLGITWTGFGCVQNQTLPTAPAPKPKIQPEPVVVRAKPRTKRSLQAVTFVAGGEMLEHDAEEKGVDPSRQMNLYDEARQAYQQALRIDPKHLPAYTALARVYMKMNHYDKALETYNQAAEKFPREFSLWVEMGMCYCRTKQWDLAVLSFKKALESDPENRQVTQTLGFCLARAGRIQESLEALQQVMPPAQAHYQIGRMLHHVQRDDLCREELRQAVRLDPEFVPAQALLASLDGPPPSANASNAANGHVQIQIEK